MKTEHLYNWLIIIFIFIVLGGLTYLLISIAIINFIFPAEGTSNVWIDIALYYFYGLLAVSFLMNIAWYGIEQAFIYPKNTRSHWYVYMIIQIILSFAIAFTLLFLNPLEEGSWLIYLIFTLCGALLFYLPTAFGSPSAFKYAPPMANEFRKIRPTN